MFYLSDVLQFVIQRFYDGSFPKQQPIRDSHQRTFHVILQLGNELYAIHEQMLEKLPTDISLVSDQFPIDFTQKALVLQRFPVIDIAGSDAEVEDFSFLIAYDMEFETEEPSHRALTPGGYSLEHLMHVNPLVLTYTQWSAVHEGNAGALAAENLLDEQGQGKGHIFFQLYETVI
jgi:hypothetical protein